MHIILSLRSLGPVPWVTHLVSILEQTQPHKLLKRMRTNEHNAHSLWGLGSEFVFEPGSILEQERS